DPDLQHRFFRDKGKKDTVLRQSAGQQGRSGLGKEAAEPATCFVREYAHRRDPGSDPSLRQDFTDVVYWHPALVLPDGRVEVSFALNDAVTTYRVTVWGHTLDGRLAATPPITFSTQQPLTVDPVTASELTAGDKMIMPTTVTNRTGEDRKV